MITMAMTVAMTMTMTMTTTTNLESGQGLADIMRFIEAEGML